MKAIQDSRLYCSHFRHPEQFRVKLGQTATNPDRIWHTRAQDNVRQRLGNFG